MRVQRLLPLLLAGPLWLALPDDLDAQYDAGQSRADTERPADRLPGPFAAPPTWRDGAGLPRSRRARYWGSAGLGSGTRGAAGHLGASYQTDGTLLSVRAAGTIAVFDDELWDLGIVFGRSLVTGVVHASVGAGAALVRGARRESIHDDPEPIPSTVGLPIEVQLSIRPIPVLGIGLYGFANVNREETFRGVTVAVQLGNLR
jgi:hypothetical protein